MEDMDEKWDEFREFLFELLDDSPHAGDDETYDWATRNIEGAIDAAKKLGAEFV